MRCRCAYTQKYVFTISSTSLNPKFDILLSNKNIEQQSDKVAAMDAIKMNRATRTKFIYLIFSIHSMYVCDYEEKILYANLTISCKCCYWVWKRIKSYRDALMLKFLIKMRSIFCVKYWVLVLVCVFRVSIHIAHNIIFIMRTTSNIKETSGEETQNEVCDEKYKFSRMTFVAQIKINTLKRRFHKRRR